MAFIGNTNTTQAFTPAIDYFSGNGSTTAFTLSRPVASVAQVQVTIDNVAQNPSSAFTVSSNTITFTSAPLSGTNNIYVYYTSPITQVIAPGQGTVTATSMASSTGTGAGVFQTSPTITTPVISSLSSASATALTLQSAGTTAITVDTSQNVGIGTASPNLKLTVSGQTISGATGGNGYVLNSSGANYGFISNPSSGVWSLGYGTTPATLGTTVLSWSSSGYVITPSQPAFRAYLSSGYTCTTGYQTMPFDSTSLNTSSSFSTGTYTFTAPVAGTYFFTAMSYWTSSGSGAAYAGCTIWSNGSQKATGYIYKNTTGSDQCAWSSLIISMSAGDTAYVRTDMSAGLVLAAGNGGGSWFCGYLLG